MIIILLLASTHLFVSCFIMRQSFWHHLGYLIGLVLLILSIIGIVLNVRNHFGMEKVTHTVTQNLVSDTDEAKGSVLLYQPLGDGTEKVFLYKTDDAPKDLKKTSVKQENVTIHVKSDAQVKNATLVKKTVRWEYKTGFYRFLFSYIDNNRSIESMQYDYTVPASWLVISTDQAKKIQEYSEKNKAQMAKTAKEFVTAQMTAFVQKNPTASNEAKQTKMTEFTNTAQLMAVKKMLDELKIVSYTN